MVAPRDGHGHTANEYQKAFASFLQKTKILVGCRRPRGGLRRSGSGSRNCNVCALPVGLGRGVGESGQCVVLSPEVFRYSGSFVSHRVTCGRGVVWSVESSLGYEGEGKRC